MKGTYKAEQIGTKRPWIAEIQGWDDESGFVRRFVKSRKDYTGTNSKGTRGIWHYWTLEAGHLYEVKHQITWASVFHGFVRVDDETGEVLEVTRGVVEECLRVF